MFVIDGVEMLDVREAARLAGRTSETVRRWIWSGRLRASRQGNRLLVARHEIDELMNPEQTRARPLTLAQWATDVEEHRRSGALSGPVVGASSADVVLDDRSHRQAG